MSNDHASTEPVSQPPGDSGGRDLAASYEALRLNGLIRNWSALAVLVLAYSMDWMDLLDAGRDLSRVHATGLSMSAPEGGRQSIVLQPGDMEVFGIPLTMAFIGLLIAAILRVTYPQKRRLHPLLPLTLAAPGTIMLGCVLGYAVHDETARFLTSGFYFALAAFVLNTLFDFIELLDWRALRATRGSGLRPET